MDAVGAVDVVVVGAGFAGLGMLHRLRELGLTACAFEAGADVGGTWYWNRYPGARVDIPSVDYMFSFDPDWRSDWQWSEKYATQPEILRYLEHVADKFGLRRDIRFNTRVTSAAWDDATSTWRVHTDRGDEVTCRHLVMATGCLSMPKDPDVEGLDRFGGEVYLTGRWPHEPPDFTGERVAVIGTGSSGIQSIPLIAQQAREVLVFQRTPCFSIPAHNGPLSENKIAALEDEPAYRAAARESFGGVPVERTQTFAFMATPDERRARYERAWQLGELLEVFNIYADLMTNPRTNDELADFLRAKIRAAVQDPRTADALSPTGYPVGAKRLALNTDYFETFNAPHVRLVDLRAQPLRTVTETGIDTAGESFEVDAIVLATGFDAMTGAVLAVDITGRNGLTLKDKWAQGPSTYLGLTVAGFPNLFLIAGPGSPSVLSNMAVSIEQHIDVVADVLAHLRTQGLDTIEPTATAETGWMRHLADGAAITLFPQANSWYMGANVPGKPQVFMPYTPGVDAYAAVCADVVEQGYLGFRLTGPDRTVCNDGLVRRLQPDIQAVLEQMAELNLPPMESLPVDDARGLWALSVAAYPPGPEVGEVLDGKLPGPAGELAYRLYRPATPGPHPVIVYWHGGGWVLGDETSDDSLCRDLCVRTDALVVSVNYRHGPEHPFPAAVDDGYAALRWVAEHAAELGGVSDRLAVAGWSAGANMATVMCHLAREQDGPRIAGQALLTPPTDTRRYPSHTENAVGYGLTTGVMDWFRLHYCAGDDPADPDDPRLAPLRAADLSGLPPAVVITAEFDPLRDEGDAYAEALAAAGVPTRHVQARGHTHLSPTMVDLVVSGAPIRAEMAEALRGFLSS